MNLPHKTILQEYPALNNHNWKHVGKRKNNSVLNRDIYLNAFSREIINKIVGINHGCRNLLFLNEDLYVDVDEFTEFADEVFQKAIEDPSYYGEIIEKFAHVCEKFEKYARELMNKDFSGKSNEELWQTFDDALKSLLPLISFSYFNHNEEEIANRLLDYIAGDSPLKGKLLVPPDKKTLLQQEKEELMFIAAEVNDLDNLSEQIKIKIKKHIQKYCWINSKYYNITEVTYEETVERLRKLVDVEIQNDQREDVDFIIATLNLIDNKKRLLHSLREQLFYKTHRKELISLFSWAVKDLFYEIAKKQGIRYEEFTCQTVDEIVDFLQTSVTNRKGINERINGYNLLYFDEKKIITSVWNEEQASTKVDSESKIVGTTGNPGNIEGKVRVVTTKDELSKLQVDEILVVDTLSPDMSTHITTVRGIVTDSGGILCHAVIVARELGVPCVVGTRNATSLLKTGDTVELNADIGEIKRELQLPDKKFKHIGTITMGLCRADLYMPTHVFNTVDVIGKGHNEIIFWNEDGKTTLSFSYDAIRDVGQHGLVKLKSPEFVESNRREVEQEGRKLWQMVEFIASHQLKHIPQNELLEHYNNLFLRIQKMFGYFNVSQPSISYAIEEEITRLMQQQGIDANTQFEILSVMLKQDETTLIEEEEKELLKIALNLRESLLFSQPLQVVLSKMLHDAPHVHKELLAHKMKYSFLASSENFDEFDMQYYVKRLQDMILLSEHELHSKIAEKSPNAHALAKQRDEICQKHNLSDELVHIMDVGRIYSHQRMVVRIFWTKAVNVWGKILREFARKMNISEVDIQYYLREEINRYFETGIELSKEEIEKRKKPHAYVIWDRQKPLFYHGEEAQQIHEKYLKADISNATSIVGTIANKGIKRGRAKLLLHGENMVKQIYEMEEGDILVTGNTRPDMMLALEKASAVVTDEGGICSHAAIVSRELGIPCVIGTVNATKIFKEGDIIEVDGDTGVVRKIE
jgi:phosphoenolpyruvate synthase/pyruvate phosphate dikinase